MSNRAIIVVDLQNEYWPEGGLPLANIAAAAGNAARIMAHGRATGNLLVNVRHEMPAGAPVFAPGSHGAQIHASVAPGEGEAVITKAFPNSFRDIGLKALLDQQGKQHVLRPRL